jgi:hypothetical protein
LYCGSDQSYVIKYIYYEIMEERCVPVENVTAVVFLLVLYRYQLQFGGAEGPPKYLPTNEDMDTGSLILKELPASTMCNCD